MDGSIHECTISEVGHHQEDDQVVPGINLDHNDDLVSTLAEHVLMCFKVVEFLKKETRSAQHFPDPFYIVHHRVEGGDNLSCLRIVMEIENRPVDKYLLEIFGIILRYNYRLLEIDGISIQRGDSEKPTIRFKFKGFSMGVELQLVTPSQSVAME